jgi:AhpD family alkylhydroperoxidase
LRLDGSPHRSPNRFRTSEGRGGLGCRALFLDRAPSPGDPGSHGAGREVGSRYPGHRVAAGAQNGCGICIDGHEQTLTGCGVTAETIQAAARTAAAMKAVATVYATLGVDNNWSHRGPFLIRLGAAFY